MDTSTKKCPRCDSPKPELHPAMQWEGEVQPCSDPFHTSARVQTDKPIEVELAELQIELAKLQVRIDTKIATVRQARSELSRLRRLIDLLRHLTHYGDNVH